MIDHNFYASPVQASQTLITHILEAMDKELERPFTIALSGGTTPATLFEVWEREYAAYTPWPRIYFYWVDERCVPPCLLFLPVITTVLWVRALPKKKPNSILP